MISIELSMRGLLRGFGPKVGQVGRRRLPERTKELADGNEMLTATVTSMLRRARRRRRRPPPRRVAAQDVE